MFLRGFLTVSILASLAFCEHMHAQKGEMDMKTKRAPMFQSVLPGEATLVGKGEGKEYCAVCGMNLTKFYKTNHVWDSKQVASLHCLYEITNGQIPQDAQVVDTKNLNLIDVNKAFYVVGSKMRGTMTKNSKYAFSSEADAKEFQAQNGGEIMKFAQAYEVAGKDFDGDQKMVFAKRQNGVYAAGKEFYEKECEKTDAKQFKNVAELKANLKRTCKNADDAKLQAASSYLWDNPKNLGKAASKPKFEKIVVPDGARCPICGMFVSKNPQWAAMIEIDGGENLYFDGVKDLMKYYFMKEKKIDKLFVSDYYKLHKIDAKTAFYVIGSNVFGPMGDELIPFATEEEAMTFAKDHDGKKVIKFEQIDENLLKEL
ncbi:MAG: nitrous oxide reductase accessory protein NosL, partial [Campylobacter sp.]|nr:nitrous oxide reductase accessory protein NosL [Campylobacter sp.]